MLPGVDSLVPDQVALLDEALATLTTLVGLLTRLDALVGSEELLGSEGLGAVGTGKGALPSVDALVADQAALPGEALATLTTLVGLFTRVDALGGLRSFLDLKVLGQWAQVKGCSPVWMHWWLTRLRFCMKLLPH